MGIVLVIILAIMFCAIVFGGVTTNPFSMVVAIVAIAVFSGLVREIVKNKKEHNKTDQTELVEIKQRISQIEVDIADIKEQIADFLIKQI